MKGKITLWEAAKRSEISFNWWRYRVQKKRIQVEKADGVNWITPEEYEKAIALYNRELAEKASRTISRSKSEGVKTVFKIEKNIPMPPYDYAKKYPFSEMEIGDSFLIPVARNSSGAERKRIRTAVLCSARHQRKAHKKKFETRTLPEGIRVWRVD